MFYRKNLPAWERAARVLGGAAMVACGFVGFPGMPIGYLIDSAGVVTVMTGFFGFCPMCAMARSAGPSACSKPHGSNGAGDGFSIAEAAQGRNRCLKKA